MPCRSNLKIKDVTTSNLLEDDFEATAFDAEERASASSPLRHKIPLTFRPYEIKTLRIILQ